MQLHNSYLSVVFICACIITPASIAAERAAPVTEPASAGTEQRLQNIERLLQNQGLLDMLQQLQSLQKEVANLRGQVELNNHELEKLKEQQRKLYSDIDTRLQNINSQDTGTGIAAGTETPPLEEMVPSDTVSPAGAEADTALTVESVTPDVGIETANIELQSSEESVTGEVVAAPVANPIEAQAHYQEAFRLLKQAEYDQAIAAFDKFLNNYPDSQYSENAQYWMAEALYVKRRFNEAITEYMKLVSGYPESQRAPNCLLKIGYSYYELGQADEAKKVLQDLIQKFPGTTAARDAEDRLKRSSAS